MARVKVCCQRGSFQNNIKLNRVIVFLKNFFQTKKISKPKKKSFIVKIRPLVLFTWPANIFLHLK